MFFLFEVYVSDFKNYPLKKFLLTKQSLNGRSNKGILILSGRGNRKNLIKYRLIDFNRFLKNIPGFVIKSEYDPIRSFFIMLINFLNGFFCYYLSPLKIKLNSFLINRNINKMLYVGNSMYSFCVPVGTFVYNLNKIGRSAGVFILILRKIGSIILMKLPSKEEKFIYSNKFCTVGRISFETFRFKKIFKAGLNRNIGFKSKVRGVAKNPIDHPHGGGEGRSSEGQPSVTPWGIYTKGVRTTKRFKVLSKIKKIFFFKRRCGSFW